MERSLIGKRIAFLATNGVEQSELEQPWQALGEAGADLDLVSLESGEIRAVDHGEPGKAFTVDTLASEADVSDYDGLVLPGGVASPDRLRSDDDAVRFVAAFFERNKPVAAICHGPWLLIEADVVRGRKVTSWRSLKTDLRNAGAKWTDVEVVRDDGLVTSRGPEDLGVFCASAIELFAAESAAAPMRASQAR